MTNPLASTAQIDPQPSPPPTPELARRRRLAAVTGAAVALIVVLVVVLGLGGAGPAPPATAAASIIPADALAYVNVSLDRGRPAVSQTLTLAAKLPDYPLAAAAVLTRLSAILGGGHAVDFATQIRPWLGNEAALALLDTPTSTAGSLIVLSVTDETRARAFLRSSGASSRGTYRGTPLVAYSSATELAFVQGFLVLGQDASVRAAIDVATGATASLASDSTYRRASAGEPAGRVLDAYASVAGVRRLLAPQAGVVGALGDLLYQPALQGVTIALSPAPGGARLQVHSALDPTLAKLSPPATPAFVPTLQNVMPAGAILVLDVTGLDRVAPQVLNAGSAAGVAGGIGPLLARLGSALTSEGVNVHDIVSIFHGETAVAIVPHAQSPALVIVARIADTTRVRTELAELEIPLAQLFKPPSSGPGQVPVFNDRQVGGITDHELALSGGLELDYAVSGGLVVISTSSQGIAAVAERDHTLAQDPSFRFVAGQRPARVTSLVYLDFTRLLALGEQTGLTGSARFRALRGDLEKIRAIGLSSTRGPDQSSAELSIRIR